MKLICKQCGEKFVQKKGERLCSDACRRQVVRQTWQDNPVRRQKTSEVSRRLWRDLAYRQKISEAVRQQWQHNPARRQRHIEVMHRLWRDPTHRQKMSKATRQNSLRLWRDPTFRQKMSKVSRQVHLRL